MADIITRLYSNFRGVDFRGEEINLIRSPDSLNMWKDYRKTESIRTRPGMKPIKTTVKMYGIHPYKTGSRDTLILHAGKTLIEYFINSDGYTNVLYTNANESYSNSFVFNDIFYFKDGANYLQYDGTTVKEVEGYIPTTSIGRKPAGGGTKSEDVNLLSSRRINTFVGDGTSKRFYLDAQNIDSTEVIVKVNDEAIESSKYTVVTKDGTVEFITAPKAPRTDGQDNVSIEFSKTVEGYSDRIKKCTLLQVFDNRVFFSGNKDFPNTIWHCSLNDPSYCSDLDYYNEGLDEAEVKGLVAGNNVLWVFREPSHENTTVFYHTPTIDSEYGKIYPNTHSSISIGCIGKAINFNDDIVFFSSRGMEGISGDITTEQVIAHRSTLVDCKLIAEENYENMILAEWEGYLMVFIDDKVYLADSRSVFTNENHIEYEWFYWELDKKITCVKEYKGVLYLGTEDGLYTLTDTSANVESYWVTPKDKFNNPHKLKTTNKRGCVAEAEGDISVYAKLEDTEFELIGTYEKVEDYFVSRIKRKKFKDIQLKFHSNTRFSLETISLEAFIGGYIKR